MTTRSLLLACALTLAATPLPAAPTPEKTPPLVLDANIAANLRLQFAEVEEAEFETTVFALGQLEALPQNVATVSSRIAGRVADLATAPGERVKAGAPVVRVESRQPGSPPPVIPLEAPLSGTVTALNTRLGQPVEPDAALIEITDLGELDAVARVPEYLLGQLRPGMEARVRISSYPKEIFTGTLTRLGTRVDPANGMGEAYFRLANPEGRLSPGMRCELAIITGKREEVKSIPKAALAGENGEVFVFVKDFDVPNAYLRTPVVVGQRNDERVEILKGLFPADEVVTEGSYLLSQMSGAGPISYKEALDAAHGHEHAEDGSELTPEQKAERAAARKADAVGESGADDHAHDAPGNPLWFYTSIVLLVLWLGTLAGRFLRPLNRTNS